MQGNYKGYYKRRPVDDDDRLQFLKSEWFQGRRCLDVGCNEGALTALIAERFEPSHILGVDRDKVLIDAANSRLKRAQYNVRKAKDNASSSAPVTVPPSSAAATSMTASLFRPRCVALKNPKPGGGDGEVSSQSNISSSTVRTVPVTSSLSNTNSHSNNSAAKYPFNFQFEQNDFFDIDTEKQHFETIMCMSTTKWIHLYHGDEGILRFFHRLFDLLTPEGILVLEYQPWRSYKKRKDVNETTASNFSEIKIFPSMFETTLVETIGFNLMERAGPSEEESKGFCRPILVLKKSSSHKE